MTTQTERLGQTPVGKLFLMLSLPMILGMTVSGLYNFVDAIFVTRGVGPDAIGGVSVVFPIQMMVFAIASALGSGTASIVSRKLGAKQDEAARHTAQTAVSFSVLLAIVITVLVFVLMRPTLELLGVSEVLWPYAVDYLVPVMLATPIAMLGALANDLLRAEGKMQLMTMCILLSSLLNIALDPLFIFVFDMGVRGAAIATVIAQFAGLGLAISFYVRGKTALQLTLPTLKIDWPLLGSIAALGIPFFISHAGASFMIGLTNSTLAAVGGNSADLYISAYGLVGRVMMFVILPLVGLMVAFQTISGYNYGAKNFDRVRQAIKIGFTSATVFCAVVAIAMLVFPNTIIGWFTQDQQLLALATQIGSIVFLAYFVAGLSFMSTGFFQAIGNAKIALVLSSARVYLFLLPLLLILPRWLGLDALWYAFPIADLAAAVLASVLFMQRYARLRPSIESPTQDEMA